MMSRVLDEKNRTSGEAQGVTVCEGDKRLTREEAHPSLSLSDRIKDGFRCRVLRPLLRLMRKGITPRHLAWSVAIGMVVGINPFLGTTTVVMLLIAWIFRLNLVASQIGTHLMAPLQVLLVIPFLHVGTKLFHTHPLPMDRKDMIHLSHHHPLQLIHILWRWEWHGLVVWAVAAVVLAPMLAGQIRRMLVLSLRRHGGLLRAV